MAIADLCNSVLWSLGGPPVSRALMQQADATDVTVLCGYLMQCRCQDVKLPPENTL